MGSFVNRYDVFEGIPGAGTTFDKSPDLPNNIGPLFSIRYNSHFHNCWVIKLYRIFRLKYFNLNNCSCCNPSLINGFSMLRTTCYPTTLRNLLWARVWAIATFFNPKVFIKQHFMYALYCAYIFLFTGFYTRRYSAWCMLLCVA